MITFILTIAAPAFFGFLFTGIIGNILLQKWQRRHWLAQQRFSSHEKEYNELKQLVDEIVTMLGVRLFSMRFLLPAIHADDDENFNTRLKDYQESVKKWNEKIASFNSRLSLLAEYKFAQRFDQDIQTSFASASKTLDAMIRERKLGTKSDNTKKADLEAVFLNLQGKITGYGNTLLSYTIEKRDAIYIGATEKLTTQNLSELSNFQLFKALFVRDPDTLTIKRTPYDP